MQVKTLGYVTAALTLFTLGASVQAAPKAAPVKTTAPQAVVVKLGPAMQEEYTGGEPAERITIFLTGAAAQKPVTIRTAPKPQG